jgi:hypothetical protein
MHERALMVEPDIRPALTHSRDTQKWKVRLHNVAVTDVSPCMVGMCASPVDELASCGGLRVWCSFRPKSNQSLHVTPPDPPVLPFFRYRIEFDSKTRMDEGKYNFSAKTQVPLSCVSSRLKCHPRLSLNTLSLSHKIYILKI